MWVWIFIIAPQGALFYICCRTWIPAVNSVSMFHSGCLHLFLIVKIWIWKDFLEFLKCFDLLLTFVVDGLCECCVMTSTIYRAVDNCPLAFTFCLHRTPKSSGPDRCTQWLICSSLLGLPGIYVREIQSSPWTSNFYSFSL